MACKPFSLVQCQREGSPGEGANWTTDDATSPTHTQWAIRGRFLVLQLGGYYDCTGDMHFESSFDGDDWNEFGNVKYAEAGLLKWYETPFITTALHGDFRIRVRLEYDGYEYTTTPFTISSSGEGRESVSAVAPDNAKTAAAAPRSQDAEAADVTKTVAATPRAQEASASGVAETAGSSPVTEEVTASVRSQTAGLSAHSVTAELVEHAPEARAAPREAEAEAAHRSQSAGTV